MREFEHNGVVLEYEDIGSGEPVVFLHGMGGSVGQIEKICAPPDGVRFVIPNQQGHGNSGADWEDYSFDRLADDVAALMDSLEIRAARFAGISMGAAVSLNFAVRYPERVRALLLIRSAWTDEPMAPGVVQAYADLGRCLRNGGLEAFKQTPGWEIVREPSAYTRGAFTGPFDDPSAIRNWRKYLILPEQTPIDSLSELSALTMPVEILASHNDLCHPYTAGLRIASALPQAVFTEIPDKDTDGEGHRQAVEDAVTRLSGA